MPHAAFYVVQLEAIEETIAEAVSMPHAAFYVVQPTGWYFVAPACSFNAARSILCGATHGRRC